MQKLKMASIDRNKGCVAKQCSPDSSCGRKRSRSDSETDPLSDDSAENVKKQKLTKKKESDSDDSISEECGKVTCQELVEESSDSSQISSLIRMDTDSPIFLETIKKNTSEWTDMVLPNFRIKFDTSAPDAIHNVFSKGILHFMEKTTCSEVVNLFMFRSEEDKEKNDCFQHAILDVLDIDCNGIDDVAVGDIKKLKQIEKSKWIDSFIERSDRNKRTARERICRELSTSLKNFIWQLLYMFRKRKGNKLQELSEGMYQELFVSFARIFGINIVTGPSVEKYLLTIDDSDFVAIPDAIICHPTATGDDKICAVIEVKRSSHEEECEQVRNLRSMQKTSYAQHIGPSLKGQHCGQFLCSLPYSVFGNKGMYGFVVQGTNVTLTSFKPEDGYYENLCNGYLRKKEAVVTYSKEYNFLKKEERKQLVQTFLDIGKLLEFLCEQ